MKLALVGNPNSGKTTLFNDITGSNQYVGNWPGVTVEKKEGAYRRDKSVTITDLPGIYSLSPYTLEEVVARDYLVGERPDGIINIVDGTNLQRNLFLTAQLMEFNIPMVLAVNMKDAMEKDGYQLDKDELSKRLNMPVVFISAAKSKGIDELMEEALHVVDKNIRSREITYKAEVEEAIKSLEGFTPGPQKRWFAIKLFERDQKIIEKLGLENKASSMEEIIGPVEEALDDDSESIITEGKYDRVSEYLSGIYQKEKRGKTISEKIDDIVLNKYLSLPIFAVIIFLVYYISISTVGTAATDWVNDGVFGDGWFFLGRGRAAYEESMDAYNIEESIQENYDPQGPDRQTIAIHNEEGQIVENIQVDPSRFELAKKASEPDPADYGTWISSIPDLLTRALDSLNVGNFLRDLILDGIVAGLGAVLGFLPQMFVLFLCLALLEGSGYMSRIAFVLDRVFRKFGLSGKSFIPIMVGTGCSVPGIMATRTIESERERKMTVMTTSFMPCSAKLPVIALISGAIFSNSWWIAPSAYFIGIASIIISGLILKKTKRFSGRPAPFVMELPDYRMPGIKDVFKTAWDRTLAFIKKAGTIVLLSTIIIWFTSSYGFENGSFTSVDIDSSLLASLGRAIAWIFTPLGWGRWENAVATISGFIAKENIVSTLGILYGGEEIAENGWQIWQSLAANFTALSAYSFLAFNLLAAPCFAAIGAIKREMGTSKGTLFAVAYLTIYAYCISLMIYQFGSFIKTGSFTLGTGAAILVLLALVYLIFRPSYRSKSQGYQRGTYVRE